MKRDDYWQKKTRPMTNLVNLSMVIPEGLEPATR